MQHARAADGGGSTRFRVLCAADEAFERSADCSLGNSCCRCLAHGSLAAVAGGVDADNDAHEAVLGTALSITLFGGVTFTLRYLMGRVYSG